jgi:hypothetical protein
MTLINIFYSIMLENIKMKYFISSLGFWRKKVTSILNRNTTLLLKNSILLLKWDISTLLSCMPCTEINPTIIHSPIHAVYTDRSTLCMLYTVQINSTIVQYMLCTLTDQLYVCCTQYKSTLLSCKPVLCTAYIELICQCTQHVLDYGRVDLYCVQHT